MADDNFRRFRGRNPLPHDDAGDTHDPLAELARLIGQSDPYAETSRSENYRSTQPSDDPEPARTDWPHEPDDREEYGDAPPQAPASYDSYAPHTYAPPQRGYESEQPYENEQSAGGRYFSGPAAQSDGLRAGAEADYGGEQKPPPRARELPAYATAADHADYEYDEPAHEGDAGYADDRGEQDEHYDEHSRRRRNGVIVIMAVLGLAVIGTAGAFGYFAMFGGSVLPTLPPIIKASNDPTRIMPNDAQAGNLPPPGAATTSSAETLVPREEQPLTIEPPKASPRVVSTIPVSPAGSMQPGLPTPAAPTAQVASPWPPAPPVAPPAAVNPPPAMAAPAPAAANPPPAAAPLPTPAQAAQASSEPKRVRTVTIRADQAAPSDAAPAPPAAPPVARTTPRPTPPKPSPTTSAPPTGTNAPLSIVPGAQGEIAAPAPARAAAPMALASARQSQPPMAAAAAPAPASGGYAVQVTSQRSEAEAQAAFRALQGQFPNQLSGREPIIRRADLGAKGTYYRALVGPFASMQEAAGMCSRLKAAGGNCLVQRN